MSHEYDIAAQIMVLLLLFSLLLKGSLASFVIFMRVCLLSLYSVFLLSMSMAMNLILLST